MELVNKVNEQHLWLMLSSITQVLKIRLELGPMIQKIVCPLIHSIKFVDLFTLSR